jgi:hypothetical protein
MLDFSHSGTKGVGYARHQSPPKEVIDAHPTRPDDTGLGLFRATVLQARLAARSGATGGRHPRSGQNDRKWESLHQSLCVLLDKRVSVLKFEIGYGVGIAHIGRIIKDPTSRKECFYVSVLIEEKW